MNRPGPFIHWRALRSALAACGLLLATLAAYAEIIDIDNAGLAKLVADGVPLIDIRTAPEWAETGVVPGSRLLTFYDEKGQADPAAWLAKARAIAGPDRPVALICRSGRRSKAASQFLSQQAGYRTIYNVRGGIQAWIGEGRPIAPNPSPQADCRKNRNC